MSSRRHTSHHLHRPRLPRRDAPSSPAREAGPARRRPLPGRSPRAADRRIRRRRPTSTLPVTSLPPPSPSSTHTPRAPLLPPRIPHPPLHLHINDITSASTPASASAASAASAVAAVAASGGVHVAYHNRQGVGTQAPPHGTPRPLHFLSLSLSLHVPGSVSLPPPLLSGRTRRS